MGFSWDAYRAESVPWQRLTSAWLRVAAIGMACRRWWLVAGVLVAGTFWLCFRSRYTQPEFLCEQSQLICAELFTARAATCHQQLLQ
jgi:hypothetical protein